MCHLSCVMCHLSCVQIFFFDILFFLNFLSLKKFNKVVELVGGGSVINGAYPVQFFKASALWVNAFYKSKCSSVCPCVCPSVCVFTFEVPLKRLFVPTSRSRISNIFRDFESFGKSNGKKWSWIWTFLFENCLKSLRKKKFFFADFALQNMVETTLPYGLENSGRRAYR